MLILGGISESVFGTASDEPGPLESIYILAWLCPGIALGVRRLHDIGRSGWWSLIGLTGIGGFVLLFWVCRSGENEANAWGPPPGDSSPAEPGSDNPEMTGPADPIIS